MKIGVPVARRRESQMFIISLDRAVGRDGRARSRSCISFLINSFVLDIWCTSFTT